MPTQRYTMLSKLIRFLGPARWASRVPNISVYGLTGSEAEVLIIHWRSLMPHALCVPGVFSRSEALGDTRRPLSCSVNRLRYFSMRKSTTAHY